MEVSKHLFEIQTPVKDVQSTVRCSDSSETVKLQSNYSGVIKMFNRMTFLWDNFDLSRILNTNNVKKKSSQELKLVRTRVHKQCEKLTLDKVKEDIGPKNP